MGRLSRFGLMVLVATSVPAAASAAPVPDEALPMRASYGRPRVSTGALAAGGAVGRGPELLLDRMDAAKGDEEAAAKQPPIQTVYPSAGPVPRALWHLGGLGERAVRRFYGVKPGVRLGSRTVGGLLETEVRTHVDRLARSLHRAPSDATITHPDGVVVPDRPGQRVDIPSTVGRIWAAKEGAQVDPDVRVVYARWRTADMHALTAEIGRYRTWIDGSSGRYMNIEEGARRINNRILFPGETFSTLKAIGDVTKEPGWHRAPVIISGAYVDGWGGGLCQVSSTLYNAVAKAGLKIVERHHHAKPVHYVPQGRDATIAWPRLDFRFQNNRTTPVIVRAYVRGGALWTMIMGSTAG